MSLRLLRIDIQEFRSIQNQWLPADGLVVLFGPNSAGKTSVLEAAEHLITQAGTLRADPGVPDELFVMGSVMFDLPGADVAGSQDARTYRSLLCGEYSKASVFDSRDDLWAWLGDGITGQLKEAGLGEARSLLAEVLTRTGSAGTPEDRELLATSIFDPGAVFFTADAVDIDLAVYGPSMRREAMDAARRIATLGDADDALCKIAGDLVSSRAAYISRVAGGAGHWESFAAAFPPVILLDGDPGSLSAELQRAVPAVHDRLWHVEPEVVSSGSQGVLTTVEGFEIREGGLDDRYVADPWLEGRSESGEPILPDIFDPYDQGDWYRVRHSLLAATKLIEAEANRVAPGFVTRQGVIGVEILPVSVWGSGLPRVRATFTESGDEKRDLKVVGAGTARWVAAAVRLACRRLEQGRQLVTDEAGAPVDGEDARRQIVRQARGRPLHSESGAS